MSISIYIYIHIPVFHIYTYINTTQEERPRRPAMTRLRSSVQPQNRSSVQPQKAMTTASSETKDKLQRQDCA